MKHLSRRTARITAAAATAALLVAACGSDDDGPAASSTSAAGGDAKTVTVTAMDYAYSGDFATIDAGTKLQLKNESTKELHELVAFAIPATETRPVGELLQLPEAELEALVAGEPATVIIAPPGGSDQIIPVGDGTLTAPGRYAIICAIPVGADPTEYLTAANDPTATGAPDVAGGPPHFTKGMFAEITVK